MNEYTSRWRLEISLAAYATTQLYGQRASLSVLKLLFSSDLLTLMIMLAKRPAWEELVMSIAKYSPNSVTPEQLDSRDRKG